MTTLNEIRTTLLKQHADIRARIVEARAASADRTADAEHLRGCLSRLANAVRMHNVAEEEALKTVLPTIDAWGAVRKEVMDEEHVAEHSDLYGALVEASAAADPAVSAAHIGSVLDRVIEHMDHEEKTFLGAELLTEEAETRSDGYGG